MLALACSAAAPAAQARTKIPVPTPLSIGDHTVRVNGVVLAYHVSGRGPLLVVPAPGWGIGSVYLRGGLAQLEAIRTLVYIDERGSGDSGRPADPHRMSYHEMSADLEALRAVWGQRRMDLLGHSAGATIAMDYASRHPDRVGRLVLVDAELPGFDVSAPRTAFKRRWLRDPAHAEALQHYDDPLPTSDTGFSRYLHRTIGWYFSDPARYAGPFAKAIPAALPAWTLRMSIEADRSEAAHGPIALRHVHSPTLIVVGRDDAECPVEMAQAVRSGIAGSRLVVLNRSGHFPWIEAPRPFFRLLRGFLAA